MALLVVFDVNVYLDACLALDAHSPYPGPWNPAPPTRPDVGLACFSAVIGMDADADVELFSDELLDQLVLLKLTQSADAAVAEHRGFGWSDQHARQVMSDLFGPLDASGRSLALDPAAAARHLPGADYEDQRVFGLLREASGQRPWCDAVVVTSDGPFAQQVNAAAPRLRSGLPAWAALSPARFLAVAATV